MTTVEVVVAAGRAAEFEALTVRRFAMLKEQPGFDHAVLSVSLGLPNKYRSIHVWKSLEAQRQFQVSDAWRTFTQSNVPSGLTTPFRPLEAYGVVHQAWSGRGDYLVMVDWTIDAGRFDAFEAAQRELFALRQKLQAGFGVNVLYRNLGIRNRYCAALVNANLDGNAHANQPPEIQAFLREHPLSLYSETPAAAEQYLTVLRS